MTHEDYAAISAIVAGITIALVAIWALLKSTEQPLWGLFIGMWLVWATVGSAAFITWYFK